MVDCALPVNKKTLVPGVAVNYALASEEETLNDALPPGTTLGIGAAVWCA